jgi:hypothetical protein
MGQMTLTASPASPAFLSPVTLSAAALAAANINPKTRLATDYMNHFNEAIMLLEMIPAMPECTEDFLMWEPLSYPEHFLQSNFKGRELAIAAYEAADPDVRARFDKLCYSMTSILTEIRKAMSDSEQPEIRIRLAEQATGWLKPLVAQAGGIINGTGEVRVEDGEPQSGADLIMSA